MTRIIVFDKELHEPLTIVEAPSWFMRPLEEGTGSRHLVFAVPQRLVPFYETPSLDAGDATSYLSARTCTLEFEQVRRKIYPRPPPGQPESDRLFWYAYAPEPELALLLRAAFLPGQVAERQRLEREAYIRGVFDVAFRQP